MTKKEELKIPSNKTKIICTIGPASRSIKTLEKLVENGMTIARLNFSHGTFEDHKKDIENIRKIENKKKIRIPKLIDLPGSKIRIGNLKKEPTILKEGGKIVLTNKSDIFGDENIIPVNYKKLHQSVKKGSKIFLNDGFIELKVEEIINEDVKCKIITGGVLLSKKGINLPKAKLFKETISKKDLEIIDYGLKNNVFIYCLSFIRDKNDIIKVRKYAEKKGSKIFIIVKIERYDAVKNFDEILKYADGVMIARGDLGIEIPIEDVPTVQKKLIKKANIAAKPVITATQMLNSMTNHTKPTRAEVTDVANAILDGTDAIMLSEETAIGKNPVESVKIMSKIASSTENKRNGNGLACKFRDHFFDNVKHEKMSIADVISLNVIEASKILNSKLILTTTQTGLTARLISRFKPDCWNISFTSNKKTLDFLYFSFGVFPIYLDNKKKSWHDLILKYIKEKGLVKNDDLVLLTQRRFGEPKDGTDSFGIIKIKK